MVDSSVTRRRALRLGAGGVATTGWLVGSAKAATDGKCVVIYDDSPGQDYTKTYPVHREEGAVGCVAAVTSYVRSSGALESDQLIEMADQGWEVLSHTTNHQPLGSISLLEDVEPGQTRIAVSRALHGQSRYEGAPLEFSDDTGAAFVGTAVGASHGSGRSYLELASGADAGLARASNARVRFADDYVLEVMAESKEILEGYGIEVTGLVAPYQIYDERAADLAAERYAAVANGVLGDGINEEIEPYWLNRARVVDKSKRDFERLARHAARNDALFLLGSHSWDDRLTREKIRAMIRGVRSGGLEFTTLDAMLRDEGVLGEWMADDPSAGTPHPSERIRSDRPLHSNGEPYPKPSDSSPLPPDARSASPESPPTKPHRGPPARPKRDSGRAGPNDGSSNAVGPVGYLRRLLVRLRRAFS